MFSLVCLAAGIGSQWYKPQASETKRLELLQILNTGGAPVAAPSEYPGADPGFPVGGGANLLGGGANLQFCQKFPKYHMKLRKFWAVGGRMPGVPPLRSATGILQVGHG